MEENAANSPRGFSRAKSERKVRLLQTEKAQHGEIQRDGLGFVLCGSEGKDGVRARLGTFIWLQSREEGNIPRKQDHFPPEIVSGSETRWRRRRKGADARGPEVSERGGGARLSAREEGGEVGRAAAWAVRLDGPRGGQAGQRGEIGLGWLRGSSPFSFFFLFFLFYFSKPFFK